MSKKKSSLLLLLGLAGTAIHVMNRIEYNRYSSKEKLEEGKEYEWRFGKIKYMKKGAGNPILLLHDLEIGSSSYEFHRLTEKLSETREVYTLDFLGFGYSEKPNITYTNYLYVQMVNDFIKNVIGRKTDILATGKSFPIAVMVCHNNNELVHNLIGINPESLYNQNQIPSKQTRFLKKLIETPIIGTFVYNMHANKDALIQLFQNKYYYNPYNIMDEDIEAYVKAAHTPNYQSKFVYASMVGRYMNANILHALKEINNGIYLIVGEETEDIKNISENYTYYNNLIETFTISKTKLLPHMEKPEEVAHIIEVL